MILQEMVTYVINQSRQQAGLSIMLGRRDIKITRCWFCTQGAHNISEDTALLL